MAVSKSNISLRAFQERMEKEMKMDKKSVKERINTIQEEDYQLSRATVLTVFKEVFDNYYGDNYQVDCLPFLVNFDKNKNYLAETNFKIDIHNFRYTQEKDERQFNVNENKDGPLEIFRKRTKEYKDTFFIEGRSINDNHNADLSIEENEDLNDEDKTYSLSDASKDDERKKEFDKVNITFSNLSRMNNPNFINGNSQDQIFKIAKNRSEQELQKVHKMVLNKYGIK